MIRNVVTTALTALAFSAAFAAPAVARERVVTAALQAPISEPVQFAGEALFWRCADSACTATGSAPASLQECRTVSRRVGALTRFGTESAALNEGRLAACNSAAPEPVTTAAAEPEAQAEETAAASN